MVSLQRILVATDFSASALVAVRTAAAWARASSGHVTLVHVHPPLAMTTEVLPTVMWVSPESRGASMRQARERLDAIAREELAGVDHDRVLLEHTSASVAIAREAAARGSDLVVVGTHGRSAISRALVGSVAEQVIRHAPCSVLLARGERAAAPKDLLVCSDLSAAAERGLDLALAVARIFDARATLLHVADEAGWHGAMKDDQRRALIDAEVRATLERIHAERLPPPVRTAFVVADRAEDAIVEAGARSDLIVMTTHGRTGVAHLLIGSVAERVARQASAAVLVARSAAASRPRRAAV